MIKIDASQLPITVLVPLSASNKVYEEDSAQVYKLSNEGQYLATS